MRNVTGYERPSTIEAALRCLRRRDAVVLAGGTRLNAKRDEHPVVLVDLQALRLDRIERSGDDRLAVGAMVTLQALASHPAVPTAVREAARRELPSTLRAVATLGGCVATADRESELFATLLVHDTRVRTATGAVLALEDTGLPRGRDFFTSVEFATSGACASARTGRTRADRPIVAAVARRAPDGSCRLALSGVSSRPLLVDDLDELDPPSDFRGSPEYRRALATTLVARALDEVT